MEKESSSIIDKKNEDYSREDFLKIIPNSKSKILNSSKKQKHFQKRQKDSSSLFKEPCYKLRVKIK